MRFLPILLTSALLLSAPAAAQSAAEVQALPLLHDPNAPQAKQKFTAAEKQIVAGVAQAVNARPEFKAFLAKQKATPLNPADVLLSFVAPYRSGVAERLTVFHGDEPWLLFAFGEGKNIQAFITSDSFWSLCVFSGLYTLRDINADGKREVAVVQGCSDGPGNNSSLLIFGAGQGGFQFWGDAELTYEFGDDRQWFSQSSRLFVNKGKNFQIYALRRLAQGVRYGADGAQRSQTTEEGTAVLRINLFVPPGQASTSLVRLF